MIKIVFRHKATNEQEERIYNTNNENKALDNYRREIAADPLNYSIVEIINMDEQNETNTYFEAKERIINEAIESVKKAEKSILKKPYNSKNQIVVKNITLNNSFKNDIEKAINQLQIDRNIIISINKNKITLEPTKEYFQMAD